ncbi:hypothetical protein [Crassaminicella thermophila]|uniref:hypothetical protein n=1 Tax=Crassaminicella thermophila TaxID=2599308 RepID=UPI00143D6305|nr:hypothetical protein [Crassaminicella thermophila]
MPRYSRILSNKGIYHIMIRGNERKNIFNDDEDKIKFLSILKDKKKNKNLYSMHIV